MLINPDIEAWFEKLQGRRLGGGGSASRGQGLPNYGSSALEGIVKPGTGMFGFQAPQIRSNYRPTPIAPNPGLPSPAQQVVPFQGISGGGRDLGGGAKAAGLQKLGSGIEQAMKSLAEKRLAAQRAQAIVDPLSAMKGNPGATMPPGTNNGPLGDQAARNPGATMPNIPPAAPYSPAPIGAVSDTPAFGKEEPGRGAVPPIGPGGASLPTFAQGGGTQVAGGPLPGIDFNHYRNVTAGIESNHGQSPDRPGSKYHGTYQLGPGWGGQGDEETRFLRGTTDNYNALSSALGRPPTEGELYLAHQQGADAAQKMIQNPGKTPAELGIQSRNIISNHGDPNAPSSQFAQKWSGRYGVAAGPPPLTGPSASAFAANPPSLAGPSAPQFAGPGVPPAVGSQSVIPGQTDPHAPGFDPNAVPFHRTPEMGAPPGPVAPLSSPDEIQMNLKPPRGFDAPPQGGPVTVPVPPAENRPQFDYSAPATGATNVPVPPPRPADSGQPPILNGGQPGVYDMPGQSGMINMPTPQDQLASALANGAPDVTPQLDQSAMLSMALAQPDFVAPPVDIAPPAFDFGGGFNFGGMFG